MFTLPKNSTKESHQRAQLIYNHVKDYPREIGVEVYLYCSVAKGYADQFSDIEVTFLVEELQKPNSYEEWLRQNGFQVDPATIEWGGGYTTKSWLDGIFIEAAWRPISAVEETVSQVKTAATTDHWQLVDAWHIVHAASLKENRYIKAWQNELANYPTGLQESLIKEATRYLTEPHWYPLSLINSLPLAMRQIPMHLSGELGWAVDRALRILFAINQVWEPDYKWLQYEVNRLYIKPNQLVKRVNDVYMLPDLRQRFLASIQLLLDVLTLVPDHINVTAEINHVQETLTLANQHLNLSRQ